MNAAVLMFSACLAGADPAPMTPPPAAPVVASTGNACVGGCGTATVCGSVGDCCNPCGGCGLLAKLKAKLCNPCNSHNTCEPVCAKPVCKPACPPAPVCHPAPICKVEVCDPCATKTCWYPGMFLHKIKGKLCHSPCQGGCTTSSDCGTAVIAPATPPKVEPKPDPKPLPKVIEPKKTGYNPLSPAPGIVLNLGS